MILDVSNPLAGGYLDRSAPWTTYSAIYYKQVHVDTGGVED
jgi:hypothetical protein